MKYGVLLTTSKPEHLTEAEVLESTVRYAKAAERYGYASGWVLEHHFTAYGICPDTLTFAGYLLGQTERLEIGTAVAVAPLSHPVRLAESTALLDHLSNGRFHLGIGRGTFPAAFEVFNVDPSKSSELMRESAQLVIQAWTQDSVSAAGGQYEFPPVSTFPRPVTQPHPSLFVAAESPSTIEWAAQHAFPMLTQWGIEDEEARTRIELYNEFAELAGHDPDKIPHVVMAVGHLAKNHEQAKADILDTLKWWGEEGERAGFKIEELRRLPNYRYHVHRIEQAALEGRSTAEEWLSAWLDNNPVGNVDDCVDRLKAIQAASGASHVVLGFEATGDPERTLLDIERFAEDVLPKVG